MMEPVLRDLLIMQRLALGANAIGVLMGASCLVVLLLGAQRLVSTMLDEVK